MCPVIMEELILDRLQNVTIIGEPNYLCWKLTTVTAEYWLINYRLKIDVF